MSQLLALLLTLLLDTSASWGRMLIALVLSVVIGLFLGILAATSSVAERILIPVLDVLQTLPILAFFPFAIYIVVAILPGYIGINAAVILLIVTSMLWNIAFGVYEAIKAMPVEFTEVGSIFHLGGMDRLKKIFIPASMPIVVEQSLLSWSIGLFYLVTSEIFSTGSLNYAVKYGIGVELTRLALSGNIFDYVLGLVVFIIFVIVTRFVLFGYLERKFINRKEVKKRAQVHELSAERTTNTIERAVTGAEEDAGKGISYISRNIARAVQVLGNQKKSHRATKPATPRDTHLRYAALAIVIILAAVILYLDPSIVQMEYTVLVALASSFVRIWVAFAIILAISVPVCAYLVFMSKRESEFMLSFQILASIPATVLLPIIVLAFAKYKFGGEAVAMIVYLLSGIWYMLFSMMANKTAIQQTVTEVRKIFGVKGKEAWKYVYVRALLPGIITGGITAIAAEWNASIVAEYFTVSSTASGAAGTTTPAVLTSVGTGLGKLLDVSLASGSIWLMALALINLTILIIVVNRLLWKRLYKDVMKVYQ